MTFPTKVPSDSLGRIGSLKRTSDKSLFPMALGSCGHRITGMVQKRPFSGNTRALSADPDRSRVGAGLRESLVAVLGLQVRENRVYPRSSSQ